jgi:hypothetical protein
MQPELRPLRTTPRGGVTQFGELVQVEGWLQEVAKETKSYKK